MVFVSASADVIHLKNGDVIHADQAKEDENRVQYEIGDDAYTIPKSLVQNIERGAPSQPRTSELPAYTGPSTLLGGEGQLLDQIVRGGQVNRDALSSIESQGNPAEIAVAYYIAGRNEFQGGKYDDARRDFEAALRKDPTNPAVLTFYAALLIKTAN